MLIHSAESAVVQAAVRICLHAGCRVITTEHVQQSRVHVVSCSGLESQVLALTAGQGVDVALTGQHNQAVARCVAQHGRLLDITLPQFTNNTNLGECS